MTEKIWLTICATIFVIMAPSFYLGRLWERDSAPRGDHAAGGPGGFTEPRPNLAERARTERIQAQYHRLMGLGKPENPHPNRGGLTINQFWEQVLEAHEVD